jgi:hypothetical protein
MNTHSGNLIGGDLTVAANDHDHVPSEADSNYGGARASASGAINNAGIVKVAIFARRSEMINQIEIEIRMRNKKLVSTNIINEMLLRVRTHFYEMCMCTLNTYFSDII